MTGVLGWVGGRLRPLLAEKLGLTVLLTGFFCVGWFLIPRLLLTEPRTLPLTPLERHLPFVEGWVYVYLSICLFNVAAPYLTTSRPLLRRQAGGLTVITAIAFACFAVFPVEVPAPTDRAATALYGLLLSDTRLNNLPSLHAGYTVYGLLFWEHVLPDMPSSAARRVTGALVAAWAVALIFSVLLLKQHSLVDLAAGGVLGALAYRLVFRRRRHNRVGPLALRTGAPPSFGQPPEQDAPKPALGAEHAGVSGLAVPHARLPGQTPRHLTETKT